MAYDIYSTAGIILGMGLANESRCYIVMPALIGGAHTQNDLCTVTSQVEYYSKFELSIGIP